MGSNKSWIQNNILILEIIGSKNLGSNYFQSVKNIIFLQYPEFQQTSTKILHSCVRPYKTIHNQARPFETLQGNTFALDYTKPNKTTQDHTYHKRTY